LAINRTEKCTDNHGGISDLYIFEYVKYSRSQVKVTNNFITRFPSSIVYDLNALQVNFTETPTMEEGGVSFAQSGAFQLNKILSTDSFKSFIEKEWRVIIKDNNENLRLAGLDTGLKIKYTKETGINLPDFNGFKFNFETKEEDSAPFLTDLTGFYINEYPTLSDGNGNTIEDGNTNEIIAG
jgi:hypothetical protein